MSSECEALTARFSAMRTQGLVDVKFLLQNTDEATADQVCSEVIGMLSALDQGDFIPLNFADRKTA